MTLLESVSVQQRYGHEQRPLPDVRPKVPVNPGSLAFLGFSVLGDNQPSNQNTERFV
jgi:hypothetical protein